MGKFDPYELLLRNFSKHKFKLFIERSVLNLESYPRGQLPSFGTIHKDKWDSSDLAYVDMPTRMGIMFGITSYNRWIFHLDHFEDGLILPEKIWEKARQDIVEVVNRLAADQRYLEGLAETLYDRIGRPASDGYVIHSPIYGTATLYYLTNADFDPAVKEKELSEFVASTSSEIRSIFLNSASRHGLNLDKADFGFGIGSPKTFLEQERNWTIRAIEEIEARPDSMYLQFVDGRIDIISSNKRKVYVYDEKEPKLITLDQIIDSRSYFTESEIEEFEFLLNKPNVTENELQRFLTDNPKFLHSLDYDEIRPQVSLTDESGSKLRPDFFLRPIGKRLWDILDIKLPNVTLVAGSPNRKSLSHYVHRGKAQLMNYAKFFDNQRNRERIFKATGIDCYKPSLTLVIGKKKNVDEEYWNQIIEQERPFVNILGFDELLERAKKYLLRFPKKDK